MFVRISFLVPPQVLHNHPHAEGNSCAKPWSIGVYCEPTFILLDDFLAEDKTEQVRIFLRAIPSLIEDFSESMQGAFTQTSATVYNIPDEHRIEVVIAGQNFD